MNARRYHRFLTGLVITGVLTADTIWISAVRDSDVISQMNPWITFIISILTMIWATLPLRLIIKYRIVFNNGYEIGLDEGLWLAFGWWLILIFHIGFQEQPHLTSYERASWILVYFSMMIFSLGCWLIRHRSDD